MGLNHMKTKLIEFKNKEKETLRGILLTPEAKNDKAVLMCGGFERSTTTEKKFKTLADKLARLGITSFRFDYAGCGLSDGKFSDITVKKMSSEIKKALKVLKRKTKNENIIIIGHSLSGCAIAKLINKESFGKIILLAPALNQKELRRLWFVISEMQKKDSSIKVTWQNYKNYLDEKAFKEDSGRVDKSTKEHYISSDYFIENAEKNYTELFNDTKNVLLIHGNKDEKVPFESITKDFENKLILDNADHDMEKPDIIEKWITKAIDFIR